MTTSLDQEAFGCDPDGVGNDDPNGSDQGEGGEGPHRLGANGEEGGADEGPHQLDPDNEEGGDGTSNGRWGVQARKSSGKCMASLGQRILMSL